jgi:hypothetical protein
MGCLLQINYTASKSADSGNWLAAILLIVGLSFPLQFKQIGSMVPMSAVSQWQEAYCC